MQTLQHTFKTFPESRAAAALAKKDEVDVQQRALTSLENTKNTIQGQVSAKEEELRRVEAGTAALCSEEGKRLEIEQTKKRVAKETLKRDKIIEVVEKTKQDIEKNRKEIESAKKQANQASAASGGGISVKLLFVGALIGGAAGYATSGGEE